MRVVRHTTVVYFINVSKLCSMAFDGDGYLQLIRPELRNFGKRLLFILFGLYLLIQKVLRVVLCIPFALNCWWNERSSLGLVFVYWFSLMNVHALKRWNLFTLGNLCYIRVLDWVLLGLAPEHCLVVGFRAEHLFVF